MSSKDSTSKTLFVAFILCLACSVLVSTAAVFLKPAQLANKALDKQRNILAAANLLKDDADIEAIFAQYVQPKVIDLATGEYVDIDPASFDQRKAAKDPSQNVTLARQDDIASIKKRSRHALIYLVKEDGKIKNYILPIHGYGLWSTLYGFVALENDMNTVYGMTFYEHAETPGLGGEVDNSKWKASWRGKKIFDTKNQVVLRLVKGKTNLSQGPIEHQVDGLAGATLTSRGVSNILKYWMSDQGFGPYLKKIRKQRG